MSAAEGSMAMAAIMEIERLVEDQVVAAFKAPRQPRSVEYQDGARAALMLRATKRAVHCPYKAGTAQADAFFAGLDEGHALWRSGVAVVVAKHQVHAR